MICINNKNNKKKQKTKKKKKLPENLMNYNNKGKKIGLKNTKF